MNGTPPDLADLMESATRAYNEARRATSTRARSKAETDFYAACAALYWVLRSRSEA
jgi:hypothetical protein